MANRCYLYATNFVPGFDSPEEGRSIVGISEWSYDIPPAFKVLLSGNPRRCPSLIFDEPGESTAVVGDYDAGVTRLFQFLARISHPEVKNLAEAARAFLESVDNKKPYFLLECSEIYWLGNESAREQHDNLLGEIQAIETLMRAKAAELAAFEKEESRSPTLLEWLFGAWIYGTRRAVANKKRREMSPVDSLGLGGWDNVLFYDPSGG